MRNEMTIINEIFADTFASGGVFDRMGIVPTTEQLSSLLSAEKKTANAQSHWIGNVDGVRRCTDCEIASWNAWKSFCPVSDPNAKV
jgi:hypothetical protein